MTEHGSSAPARETTVQRRRSLPAKGDRNRALPGIAVRSITETWEAGRTRLVLIDSAWTKTFTDQRPSANVDRLTFGGNIVESGTGWFRLSHAEAHLAGR